MVKAFNQLVLISSLLTCGIVHAQIPELRLQKQEFQKEILEIMNQADAGELESYQTLGLARNHYQLDQYAEAEKNYLKVITEPFCTNLDYKALAICLRHNGKTSLANEFYQTYLNNVPSSTFADLWSLPSEEKTSKIKATVSQITNFDFLYGNLKSDGSVNLNIDHGTVTANIGCNSMINMEAIQFPVEDINKLGSFTIAEKPSSYYYSYQKENGNFGIFYISTKNGIWSKAKEVILGESSYDYCFPYFLNKTLFFSSNKSGGFGQFDLYQADVAGKTVSEVANLGELVNTDKNDILPSVLDGKFSFSSNGYPGEGGYDVFFSDWNYGKIESVSHLFNSSDDDFHIVQMDEESATVIRTIDDKINLVKIELHYDYMRILTGQVLDSDGNELSNAQVLFTKSSNNQGVFKTSEENGNFQITIPDTISSWLIACHKKGYEDHSFELDIGTLGANPLIIVLNKIKPVEPEPVFIVKSPSKNVIPSEPIVEDDSTRASVQDNPFNEVDNSGSYYVVYASTKTYASAYTFWQTWRSTVPDLEILENEEMKVFRVGSYAGSTHTQAMKNYRIAQKNKSDVWILRPDML